MAALCKYWAFAFILCQLGQQHMLLNSIGSMGSFFLRIRVLLRMVI